ncbi:MAG TPA: hypothetical protein VGK75_13900 [Casimicrobiaceae bacterium]
MLTAATGNWHAVLLVAAALNFVAALGAWFVLRPLRYAFIDASRRQQDVEPKARVQAA